MFETALIESQKKKAPKNRALIIQMALLMHVVLIGTVLAVQYWTIEPVEEPPIQVSFFQSAAPPPPPPPPPPPAAPKPQAPRPVVQQQVVAEIVQPDDRHAMPLQSPIELPGEVVRMIRPTVGLAEDEILVLVVGS